MRIVFMGTPDFAVVSLRALIQSGHEVVGVFTRADTPKNRGMKMLPPPVKVEALAHNLPIFQPATLKGDEVLAQLRELQPDLIVVVAYGRLLPRAVLELPRHGCINVHASLLPKYRGASPIQAAILHGERESGVTIMQMDVGLDTGDMLLQRSLPIAPDETCAQLHDRLAEQGAQALLDTIAQIDAGTQNPVPQDDARSTYAGMIRSQDCVVDFSRTAWEVCCTIRGYDPFPGAFVMIGEDKLKLFGATMEDETDTQTPGKVLHCDKAGVHIACGQGRVCIAQVQGPGGKKMAADAFFRGRPHFLQQSFV